jgi:cardiolipin synthase
MAAARERLFVQAMTFEGDTAGLAVGEAILESRAADRRVLVDAYTRHVVSDRFVWSPTALADPALRAEVRATRAMFSGLAKGGVRVRMTNPVGPFFGRYPARNHKKLIVADQVAYLGGVNFSDHNFAWSDVMLRLEGPAAAQFLADDFEATFGGVSRSARTRIGDLALYSMDGRANAEDFAQIFGSIDEARREITVVSPYLTFPFTGVLARARRRGVEVRVVVPWANNKPALSRYVLAEAARHDFEVRFLPAMSHVKAILVDGEHLIAGSSNFDFVSVAAEEEFVAVISSPALVAEFLAVLEASLLPVTEHRPTGGAWVASATLRIAERFALGARHARRTAVDWP